MAKTLVQIRKQIEALEKEAKKVKAAEVAGVITKIKTAIEFYDLTAKDLFGSTAKGDAMAVSKRAAKVKAGKAPAPAKYKDPASGKTWSGHGRRPGWFVAAVAGGAKEAELAV